MNYYAMKFGLSAGTNQGELLQALKSSGGDAIQTSDGLCVACDQDLAGLRSWLREKAADGVQVQAIDVREALASETTPADVKAFLEGRA